MSLSLPSLQDEKVSGAGDDEVGVPVGRVDGNPVPQPGRHRRPRSAHWGVAPQLGLASELDLRRIWRRLKVFPQIWGKIYH